MSRITVDAPSAAPMSMASESIVVAMTATPKEIAKRQALEWAMTNVVHSGDHVTVVALWPDPGHGRRRLWGLPLLAGDCASRRRESLLPEEEEMSEVLRRRLCEAKQVSVSVRIVSAACRSAVAMEALRVSATWVVLDSQLKKDQGQCCLEKLQCNVVVVKRQDDAKILRLSVKTCETKPAPPSEAEVGCGRLRSAVSEEEATAAASSPEARTPFTITDKGTSSSATSSEPGTSPLMGSEAVPAASGSTKPPAEASCAPRRGCFTSAPPDMDTDSDYDESSSTSSGEDVGRIASCSRSFSPAQRPPAASTGGTISSRLDAKWKQQLDYGGSISARRIEEASYDGCAAELKKLAVSTARPFSASATPRFLAQQQNHGRSSTPSSPFSGSRTSSLLLSSRDSNRHRHHHQTQTQTQTQMQMEMHPVQLKIRNHPSQHLDADRRSRLARMLTTDELLHKFSSSSSAFSNHLATATAVVEADDLSMSGSESGSLDRTSSVRRAVSLSSKHAPPVPPPLCSICQHKGPVFGKPPRRFTFAELEMATGGFSAANFLAEGGFGSVHRGVLPDGQAVAVKQHKLASAQGDVEFCSEVEVLSCAQHRNVVMLIGYCIEQRRRLLVYEFVCNGSLDAHLYGRDKASGSLGWAARQKIAVGAARGLRYLHEECRVGCIVHRDMRPNNILLTHDFQPMVGDFGLARWQPDGDLGVHTRVIGTFGYMAPEYAQSGQITEKADVYSFGVVLLELATGRKAVDLDRPKGQQCLTEWARPLLLEADATEQLLVDPALGSNYSSYELSCMLHAASLCIRKDPQYRPRMSQVLRILEGDMVLDSSSNKSNSSLTSTPCSSYGRQLAYGSDDRTGYGSRSSRMLSEYNNSNKSIPRRVPELGSPPGWRRMEMEDEWREEMMEGGKFGKNGISSSNRRQVMMSYEALKAAYKGDRNNTRRMSCEDLL